MTRSLPFPLTLPTFLVAAACIALIAFGATKLLVGADATTLAPLEIDRDEAAALPGALDAAKLYQARVQTTVAIEASIGGEPMRGSGVVVDAKAGTIVTASHVVVNYDIGRYADRVVVKFHSGDRVEAEVVTRDQFNDLAVLRIDPRRVPGLVAAPLGDSDALLAGAPIAVIGAPYGHEFSIGPGNISALERVVPSRINKYYQIPDAIQHSAPLNPGNSGGPLFNARGEVIGINQQISSKSEASAGVGFAVPASSVRIVLAAAAAGTAEVDHAWLGLEAATLTPQLAADHRLPAQRGALVQLVADGPAHRAGLAAGTQTVTHLGGPVRLGDIVVELAGQPVDSREDLLRIAARLPVGDAAKVVFWRDGERHAAQIVPSPHVR